MGSTIIYTQEVQRPNFAPWWDRESFTWVILTTVHPRKYVGKIPKGNHRLPTIHFQVPLLLLSGRVFWTDSQSHSIHGTGILTYIYHILPLQNNHSCREIYTCQVIQSDLLVTLSWRSLNLFKRSLNHPQKVTKKWQVEGMGILHILKLRGFHTEHSSLCEMCEPRQPGLRRYSGLPSCFASQVDECFQK